MLCDLFFRLLEKSFPIGIRIFVPDISHFQRWSIYWSVQVLFSFDGQVSYVLDGAQGRGRCESDLQQNSVVSGRLC